MSLIRRAVNLATFPVSAGARLGLAAASVALGADKDETYAKAIQAAAETLANTLAKTRGPAMKFGQVLALFSTALPPEQAEMLNSLSRLYEDAQAQPWDRVKDIIHEAIGEDIHIEEQAHAAASLGQVHKATWKDGRPVAIKVQYKDAAKTVNSDMRYLRSLTPIMSRLLGHLDINALLDEHEARLKEELDYRREAAWQRNFKYAWETEADIHIPAVVFATEKVLVTEWLDGTPWQEAKTLDETTRDKAGEALLKFTLLSPMRVGASHADPHPGNYRILEDGKVGVLDFGSISVGDGTFIKLFLDTFKLSGEEESKDAIYQVWKRARLVGEETTPEDLQRILAPETSLWTSETIRLDTKWLVNRASNWTDPGRAFTDSAALRFPPEYLLEHRALMGTITLVANIDATVKLSSICDQARDEYVAAERYK